MEKDNKKSRDKLKLLYGCRDMLTGLFNENLDFHHLIKKEYNGPKTIENGALLERLCHIWLHSLEYDDPELYELINECLDLYKKCIDYGLIKLVCQYETEVFPKVLVLVNKRNKKCNIA